MKKVVSILALIFVLNSCDDGGFSIDNFDFSNVTPTACTAFSNGFILQYINGNEVLLIEVPQSLFPNEITPQNQPRTATISLANRVIYRVYSGEITTSQLCTPIPPANPVVKEEWNAVSGIINIETFANRTNNATTGESLITGYTHLVTLINTNFEKASGEQQLFAELNLGGYTTGASTPNIPISAPLQTCQNNTQFIFKNNNSQAILLAMPNSLIQNIETPLGAPRTADIDQNSTLVSFRVYNNGIANPASFFCNGSTPVITTGDENWIGRTSSGPDNGIIEVVTTAGFNSQGEQQYTHEIFLRRVRFDRGAVDFTFGNLYSLGVFVTFP